jgi:hypothetical protein
MPRHPDFAPHGVIPAVFVPFRDDPRPNRTPLKTAT